MFLSILKQLKSKIEKEHNYDKNYPLSTYVNPESYIGKFTTIGHGTKINGSAFIDSKKEAPVLIGKYCAIAHNLRIRTRNHHTGYVNLQCTFQTKYGFPSLPVTKGAVIIGNNVWIADNVTILSGVKVGDGAVIGSGSIVTKDIPAYSIAAGNPAKVIKKRFSESILKQLESIKWWDWSESKIKQNKLFFETDLSKIDDQDFCVHKLVV